MAFVVAVLNFIDRLVGGIGKFGSFLIIPLILVTVFDVVTRKFTVLQQYIVSSPLRDFLSPTKLQELEWHLHAAIFLLVFGFAYLSNAHVRVDLIRESLAPRKQMLVELLGLCFLALPFVGVLVYYSWFFVEASYVQREMSPAMTGLPYRWVIKAVFLAGITLLCLSILTTIGRLLIILLSRAGSLDDALRAAGTNQEDFHVLARKQEDEAVAKLGVLGAEELNRIHRLTQQPGRK